MENERGQDSCDVLIVGAGPSGLTLANVLARQKISFRILDKSSKRTQLSKAISVQAGTLEALEAFFGASLPAHMVAAGTPVKKAYYHVHTSPLQGAATPARLDTISSRYPFLMLEQSETERLLEAQLESSGGHVERGLEVTKVVKCKDGGAVVIVDGIGEIRSRYVVGCDGAHSIVRQSTLIKFRGGSYEGEFMLGDVQVEWPWDHESIHVFLGGPGAVAAFPLKNKYRLIAVGQASQAQSPSGTQPSEFTLAQFEAAVQQATGKDVHLSDPVWLARFRVHHRLVKTYRSGPLFLVGDAAHLHSPVGGQGMNLGMQEALNLGEKFARVLISGANPGILDEYEDERMPVARKVVRSTDFVFRMLLKNARWKRVFVQTILPRIIAQPWLQKRVVRAVSQVDEVRRDLKRFIKRRTQNVKPFGS